MITIKKETDCGTIRGLMDNEGVCEFRGIRYATAERWKYPVPVGSWDGVYDATAFKDACTQMRTFDSESAKSPEPFYYREFRKDMDFSYSEDCLFLNIWAPAYASNAPVILYIHGGAFMGGCGNEMHMDGTEFAKRGVIFVSINYRLGIFGFLCSRELEEESSHTGNYGLYDQAEAIQWVKRHISSFGGDPERITLFGQSAGAMCIQQLVLSPAVKPLIAGAYMSSGGGISREFGAVTPLKESLSYCAKITKLLGDTPQQWRQKTAKEVLEAVNAAADRQILNHLCPHIDGHLIPEDPAKAITEGKMADIPYLLSSNSEDMMPDVLQSMAVDFCTSVNALHRKSAWYFKFTRQLPGDNSGAFHSAELWYSMGTLRRCWRPMQEIDYALSNALVSALCCFAETGSPESSALPDWKPMDHKNGPFLEFGDTGVQVHQ
jgi:carboxylesterase type B